MEKGKATIKLDLGLGNVSEPRMERDPNKVFVLQGIYRVVGILEELSYSKVFLAQDLEKEVKEYAIKQVPVSSAGVYSSPELKQFTELVKEYMSLYHPYLAKIVDFFYEDSYEYIVMNFVKGRRLQEVIDVKKSPFKNKDVTDIGLMMAGALNYMHKERSTPLYFADLSPSNIIITPLGGIELTDYGLGKFLAKRGDEVPYRGTAGFAAPEQYRPNDLIDAQTDIYGLGAVLFYMATNIHPANVEGRLPNVRESNENIDEKLASVIYKATEPIRKNRYTSVKQFVEDLINIKEIIPDENLSKRARLKLWFSRLINRNKVDI